MPAFKDITGQRFGRLTVVSIFGKDDWGKYLWLCDCDCGGTATTTSTRLKSGHTKSCGCLQKEKIGDLNKTHGRSRTREYRIWCNMKSRCYNPKFVEYPNYGERGIRICEKWIHSFENFYAGMGPCPTGYSIERIDNNGHYEPKNCKWADSYEQGANKRNNVVVRVDGVKMTASQASRALGVHASTIIYRAKHNIPVDIGAQR